MHSVAEASVGDSLGVLPVLTPMPTELASEITERSHSTREHLIAHVLEAKMDAHVMEVHKEKRARDLLGETHAVVPAADAEAVHKLVDDMLQEGLASDGSSRSSCSSVAEVAGEVWHRMQGDVGASLPRVQQAELFHVRNMISSLKKSLAHYEQLERDILFGAHEIVKKQRMSQS